MNASGHLKAPLNHRYAILESMVRKDIIAIGLDTSIGCLHEMAPYKHLIFLFMIYRNYSDMLLIVL